MGLDRGARISIYVSAARGGFATHGDCSGDVVGQPVNRSVSQGCRCHLTGVGLFPRVRLGGVSSLSLFDDCVVLLGCHCGWCDNV